ncbi:MAG TPA: antitoxin Xre/MbcA/ParS toxin-binding domain-containing protein [Trueperaceae bacterium]|nr:antitoxin Xre/MbcA/ParS toxin-binding domain-containing protein [Trueperaceae bacterium]
MTLARAEDALFQDVLGARTRAVEKAVIDRQTTGEKSLTVVVERMAELFDTTKRDTYLVLGITSSKVSRRPEMDVEILDRAGAALKLYARVSSMSGGNASASEWFGRPNLHLDGRRPLDLLSSSLGRQRLSSMVTALEDGAFL